MNSHTATILRACLMIAISWPSLAPAQTSLEPINLTRVGNLVYFSGADSLTGRELWVSDGTMFGTRLVRDLTPGPESSTPTSLLDVNGILYFGAGKPLWHTDLWRTDASEGAVLVTRFEPFVSWYTFWITLKGVIGGKAIVETDHFVTSCCRSIGLYSSDGAGSGTALLAATGYSVTYFYQQYSGEFEPFGDFMYFVDQGGLWRTDGTKQGTSLFKAFPNSPTFFKLSGLTVVGNKLRFMAGVAPSLQQWQSDGTEVGTAVVQSTDPGGQRALVGVDGTSFCYASDADELWKCDGTPAGTFLIKANTGLGPGRAKTVASSNGTLFFAGGNGTGGSALWKSDGTTAGTVIVKDFQSYSPSALTSVGGILFFAGTDATNGTELWKSDGTTAGTVLVKDIAAGSANSSPKELVSAGGLLFFVANDGVHGSGLWRSGGSASDTFQLDATPTVRIEDSQSIEGNAGSSLLAFNVRLNRGSASDLDLTYLTFSGSATSGDDFVVKSGTLTIPAGVTSKRLVVEVRGDATAEPDETLSVTLAGTSGVLLERDTALGTIVNDDPASTANTVTQYRLYSDVTKEHLYTTDQNEYTVLGTRGWTQEGIAYKMLTSGSYNGVPTIPLFRLYHPGIQQHHWTTDSNEAAALSANPAWFFEGTIGYLLPSAVSGAIPLYRMSLASPPLHLWTTDQNEHDTLATRGWTKEGIVGHVIP
jgi:ELWxxDGT repeat protein